MLAGVCALIVASQSLIADPSVTQPPMPHPVDAQRSSDEALQRAVTRRLIDHVVPPDGVIIVTVKEGLVRMRGRVGSVWTRTEAVRQALHVEGVVNVANELTIEPWPDGEIDEQIGDWMYRSVFYSIFDVVSWEVRNGVVSISGVVTEPYKMAGIVDLVSRAHGVVAVSNALRTIDVSDDDRALQASIALAIYRSPPFWAYGLLARPPVHILVESGHVTLIGDVESGIDRTRIEEIVAEASGETPITIDNRLFVRKR